MADEEKNEQEVEEGAAVDAPAPEEAEEAPEALSPKEIRRQARSAHSGEARPPRTLEERTAERVERRRKKAEERRRWRVKSREKRRAAAGPREGTPPAEDTGRDNGRERLGTVVSDKADKTITVRVDIARQHRTYGKIVRTSSTLHAHDEANEASAGDTVRVVESRPLSRKKRWRLVEILEKAR
jgi:small subunit ribosomal protein S17